MANQSLLELAKLLRTQADNLEKSYGTGARQGWVSTELSMLRYRAEQYERLAKRKDA